RASHFALHGPRIEPSPRLCKTCEPPAHACVGPTLGRAAPRRQPLGIVRERIVRGNRAGAVAPVRGVVQGECRTRGDPTRVPGPGTRPSCAVEGATSGEGCRGGTRSTWPGRRTGSC